MPTRRRKIASKHAAGGINLSSGELNLKFEENTESRNMKYEKDGTCFTGEGYGDPGWAWGEDGEGIDGLFVMGSYPDILWASLNGKIKYVNATTSPQSTATVYTADTGLSLTKDNPVFFGEYRGMLYFCNGVENLGRIAIGQFASAYTSGGGTITMNGGEAYKFTNGADKIYSQGDEMDYTAVSGDTLTTVTNDSSHGVSAYITQYDTITAPSSGSGKCTCFAFFKDTMWIAGMPDEPNVLRYSKTVANVANIVSGHIHNFSDGNNYLIGDGGDITALLSTRDRLYVFLKDKIYYIGIEVTSTGTEAFSREYLFSGIHGCPNPFCVAEMGEVVVVFTGKRCIRIGYDPTTQQLLPDEGFDEAIQSILQDADTDQSGAEVHYNEDIKELRLKFKKDGIFQTAIYNNTVKQWSYPSDIDSSRFVKHGKTTYFGFPEDDVIYRFGLTLDGDDVSLIHRYVTGRQDGGSRNPKLFLRGKIEGEKRAGNTLYLTTYIDNQTFGGARTINDTHILLSSPGTPLGEAGIGEGEIGGDEDVAERKHFIYPFLIGRRGRDIRLVFSSNEIGSDWGVTKMEVTYEENDMDPATHY